MCCAFICVIVSVCFAGHGILDLLIEAAWVLGGSTSRIVKLQVFPANVPTVGGSTGLGWYDGKRATAM